MHAQVKLRIVMLHGTHLALHTDVHVQLLAYLAPDGLLLRLARFHLPSGKLPQPLVLAIPALRGQDSSVLVDNGRYYFDCLHTPD